MNLYIRTLGFDNMTSEAEAKFIKTGIRESIKEGFVIRHEKLDRSTSFYRWEFHFTLSSPSVILLMFIRENTALKRIFLNMSTIFRLLWGRL